MKGGDIVVMGNAGSEIGGFMLGGRIHIRGHCGSFAGVHMRKGLIVVDGGASSRVGAQMIGGNIVVAGGIESMLPSFVFKEEETIQIYGKRFEGVFLRWSGDHAESCAKGKLYVRKDER